MEPIRARCRDCDRPFLLQEVVRTTGGRCPSCGVVLAPGWTLLLLEEARRADVLQRRYVHCLRRLDGLPGALALDAEAIVRGALEAAGLEEQLADDARVLREEIAAAPARVRAWRWMPRPQRDEDGPRVVAALRRIGQRLRRHGELLERWGRRRGSAAREVPAALAQAAAVVDEAAAHVAADRRLCDDRTARAMAVAARAVDEAERVLAEAAPAAPAAGGAGLPAGAAEHRRTPVGA